MNTDIIPYEDEGDDILFGEIVAEEDGPGYHVGTLEEHENAAMVAAAESIDSKVKAYYHLALIYHHELWREAGMETWGEYIKDLEDRLPDEIAMSLSSADQRLRDFQRWVVQLGIPVDRVFTASPRTMNVLTKVAGPDGWVRRGEARDGEEEGALRRWAPGVRENLVEHLQVEEGVDDDSLLRGLFEEVYPLEPKDADRLIRSSILKKTEEGDVFEIHPFVVDDFGARFNVRWDRVDARGIVVKTWFGDPFGPGVPREVVEHVAKRLGTYIVEEG